MSEYDEALPLECYQDAFQGGSQERQSQSQLFPAVSSSTVVKMVENWDVETGNLKNYSSCSYWLIAGLQAEVVYNLIWTGFVLRNYFY